MTNQYNSGLIPEIAEEAMPKVAVVCHSHPSLSKGGAEIAAYALFRGLRENGANAIFICACDESDRYRLAFADENEFAVYCVSQRYEHFYHLSPQPVADQLLRIILEQGVRIVNFHHFLNFGLNSLRSVRSLPNLRCYFTIHEFLAICHHHGQMVTRPAQLLCSESSTESCVACYPEFLRTQFAMRKNAFIKAIGDFDGFISPSHFVATRYVEWGLPIQRMEIIENGLMHTTQGKRHRNENEVWTFGYFGQINPFKGVDVLLEASELIADDPILSRNVRVRVHGNFVGQSESFHERFEKARTNLAIFTYAGPYNTTSVYRLMRECDYVVVTSKWWENSPVVIQEAYAVGNPVICSGVGGMAEKVTDGISGLHFRMGDARDLVRALTMATEPNLAMKLRGGIPPILSAPEMARRYARVFLSPSTSFRNPLIIRELT